ncbi:MAG: macro domain-containing protein [Proteobacteria bacterium]|nr:macro domain-containing protein [Pseudomonadota bacterium]
MINFTKGDILKKDTEAIVNTVNCVGVMGRGIALQFKKAFPNNFNAYKSACEHKEVKPGSMFIYDTGNFYPRYIINFPTKRHWKGKSRIEDIRSGLKSLAEEIKKLQIKSISIPPLGCGLGGLSWEDVRKEIEHAFSDIKDVEVYLFEPAGAPNAKEMVKTAQVPNMTIGRASLISLMYRYLSAVMDPSITLLELQKLMYFMQESGENLKLQYKKDAYGPYAYNLSHVLKVIEGHFIEGYLDGGNNPTKPIEVKHTAINLAEKFLKDHDVTKLRFDRVTNLIEGFENPYGMELLSTVHWIIKEEDVHTSNDVINKVHNWNNHKQIFSDKHICIAIDTLQTKGWVEKITL